MEYRDYYKILGVPKNADDKAIKTAYRRLARKHHPDVAKGKDSAARFQEVAEAYEVLGDAEKRKRYDTLGPDWQRYAEAGAGARGPFEGAEVHFGRGGEGFSDFFRTIFGDLGGSGGGGRSGGYRDIDLGDLGDLGAGFGPDKGGDVEAGIEVSLEDAFRGVSRTVSLELDEPCPVCSGSGHVNRKPCPQCRGGGWSKGRRNLEVKIPAGVATGSRVRVGGKGQVSMKIPPETTSGRSFRLPGYGMPHLKGGGAGDQFVQVQLTIPSGLSPRERELYQELKKLRT